VERAEPGRRPVFPPPAVPMPAVVSTEVSAKDSCRAPAGAPAARNPGPIARE
jgi:hypothetical protein